MNKASAEKLIRGTIHERGNGLAGRGGEETDESDEPEPAPLCDAPDCAESHEHRRRQ